MKLTKPQTFALAFLLLALVFAGCAAFQGVRDLSPVQRVTLAQNGYAKAVDALVDLREAGKISDADALRIEPVLIVADNALSLARARAVDGDKDGTTKALALVLRAAVEIDTFVREHK
jgi:hypothetical protein